MPSEHMSRSIALPNMKSPDTDMKEGGKGGEEGGRDEGWQLGEQRVLCYTAY